MTTKAAGLKPPALRLNLKGAVQAVQIPDLDAARSRFLVANAPRMTTKAAGLKPPALRLNLKGAVQAVQIPDLDAARSRFLVANAPRMTTKAAGLKPPALRLNLKCAAKPCAVIGAAVSHWGRSRQDRPSPSSIAAPARVCR